MTVFFYSAARRGFILKNQIDMTEGAILPKLLKFSIPLMLSSVLQLLFNAADVVVVGRFAGELSLAAVGSTSSLVNFLVNSFLGISIGCNVAAANFLGAGDTKKVNLTVHTSIVLSLVSGIVITVIGLTFNRTILEVMGSPEEVLPLSALYLKIYFSGITATVIYNFGSALLRAKGDTKRPLYILFAAGIINVILNLIFVIFFKMNVAGVAWATVLSQCFSAGAVLFLLFREDEAFRLDLRKLSVNKEILIKILKIGVPAGLQSSMFSFSNMVIQSTVNSFGSVAVAGSSVSQSIEGFVWLSMNAVAQGSLTFVSQNMGAHKTDRVKKTVSVSLLTVCAVSALVSGLGLLFCRQICSIYTLNEEVILKAQERFLVIAASYFTCGIMDVTANCLRGMGRSLMPAVVTLIFVCGSRLLYLFTVFKMPVIHSFQNIFISYPLSWILTFVILYSSYRYIIKEMSQA
jgi:putative MATE family efflux protein